MGGALWQASTFGALSLGHCERVATVGDALARGDVGIGAAAGPDGEVAITGGVAYDGRAGGSAVELSADSPLSCCAVVPFDHYAAVFLSGDLVDLDALVSSLDGRREVSKAANSLHAVIATGTFSRVAISASGERDLPSDGGLSTAGGGLELDQAEGTVVGVRFPGYLAGVGMSGWHLHFVSQDRGTAGHLLGFRDASLACQISRHDELNLVLPDGRGFAALGLDADLAARLRERP